MGWVKASLPRGTVVAAGCFVCREIRASNVCLRESLYSLALNALNRIGLWWDRAHTSCNTRVGQIF